MGDSPETLAVLLAFRRVVVDRAEGEKLVQYNVRVPESLRAKADARRKQLGLSRDEWTRRVLSNALNPAPTPIRTPAGRSLRRGR